MISLQNLKVLLVVNSATVATNAAITGHIDCKGFGYAHLTFTTPAAAATNSSAKISALAISHSDSTSSTGTAITGLTGTTNTVATSSAFVIKAHNDTSNGAAQCVGVDMRGRARYLYFTVTPGASNTTLGLVALGGRAENSIDTDSERNAGGGFA